MSLMRIEDLFHFEKGVLQSSKCTEGEFDFITASSEWKTHNVYTHDCEALVFAAAASGSLGRTHYVNGKFISSDLCFIITPKDPINFPIDLKFYHMIFNEFKNDIVKNTKAGTSKEAIGMKAFGNYKLPYFEISKQTETKIQFVNMQVSKVELNSELTHQLNLIKQLRQAFLREAMQGKLCHAELVSASQETGHDLLSKIKAEKAQLIADKKLKKEKELAPISEDEIPFEIPEHWAWCRLGEICYTSGRIGWKGLSAAEYQKSGPLFLSVHSLNYGDFVDYSKAFHITKERYDESPEIMLQNEDILICKDGAGIGKLGIIRNLTEPATINSSLLLIRKNLILNTKFVYYFFLSSHFQKIVQERIMGATTPHLYQRDIVGFPFALPPLNEQEQIVAKLEELMTYCDGLEESIKESQGYNEKLLQQVLREALQGNTVLNE